MSMSTAGRRWHFGLIPFVCAALSCSVSPPLPGAGATSDSELADSVTVFEDDRDSATGALAHEPDQLLIQPFPGADDTALADLYQAVGATVVDTIEAIQVVVLEVADGRLDEAADVLAESELIEAIHRNYLLQAQVTPNDPLFAQQSHLPQIGAIEAWDVTTGAEEIIVAVVDTGVEADHPELTERIVDGWNVYDATDDFGDEVGHGTSVAGVLAAASDNREGVAGVTWQNPLIAVRVTDEEGVTTSRHVAAGILWAAGHGAKVINVSFAPLWSNAVVRSAVRQVYNQGALVVISAGNAGGTTRSRGYEEAVFVGAVDSRGTLAPFSDRGPFVDFVAPGVGIHTTTAGSSYATPSGTSFAAPIVSGVAALAWSVNHDLRPVSIANVLRDTADDLGEARKDDLYGYGVVDAAAAVEAAQKMVYVRDSTAPTVVVTTPADRARKSGRFAVSATATDDEGVADVVMAIDGVAYATDTRSPYRFVVDTRQFEAGSHQVAIIATDTSGNPSVPATIDVTFADTTTSGNESAGTVVFTAPTAGTALTRDTTIRATVAAGAGLATVEWLVDGESVFVKAVSGDSSGVSYLWRIADVPDGQHTITLALTDARGRVTRADLALTTR